tara:strand:- start:13 stop:477 length:465 start_codon:yes stop_codon:yes gene_type:complete
MNALIQKLKAEKTNPQKADDLLRAFSTDWSDQALARIFVVNPDGIQILDRRCTGITDYDVRLKIQRRNIIRWLDKGWRVVLVADDIGTDADCHISACWGLMVNMTKAIEIVESTGSYDMSTFDAECWDLYNTGRDRWGKEPLIEASRLYEWMGF